MTEGSGRDETSVAPNAPDYARVIEHGNAILDAERVMTRFALEGTGASHTRAAAAASDPLATYAFHLGASNIASALDHLRTVAQVVQTAVIPAFSLMSLLRTGHECALVANWLLDPTISDDERVARGVGAQLAEYEERRRFEVCFAHGGQAKGTTAADRIEALLQVAGASGFAKVNAKGVLVPTVPLPKAVPLFDEFESTVEVKGSWLYRYYSGFAHGKQWALLLNATRQTEFDRNDHAVARIESSDVAMVVSMGMATDAALRAVSSYARLRTNTDLP